MSKIAQETQALPRNPADLDQRPHEIGLRTFGTSKKKLKLATLNVGTIKNKEEELIYLMQCRSIDMLGVCETRLRENGTKTLKDNYQLIFSGGESNKHGVGVMISEELAQRVCNTEFKGERILSISFKFNEMNLSVLQVYAPQQGRPADEHQRFFEDLQNAKNNAPYGDNLIIMGDLNGHVGQDRQGIENVIGAFSVGNKNQAGERVIDFCVQNHLSVMNTFYKDRESHKWTWYRWNNDRQEYTDKSMIDLVLTNNKRIFIDVKSIPSVSCDSDHRMVVGKLKMIKPKVFKSKTTRRFVTENLKDREKQRELERRVRVERENHVDSGNLEEEWNKLHEMLTKLSEEIVGFRNSYGRKRKQTPWWTETVRDAVDNKMKMFRKWMKTRQQEDRANYVAARNETERMKNEAKKTAWERIGRDLEEDLLGTRKLIYNLAKNYRKDSAPPTYAVKDEDGTDLITDPDKIGERWKDYFRGLLNVSNDLEENIQEIDEEIIGEEDRPIVIEEIREALKKMKNGKAAGEDLIPTEILKNIGEEGLEWVLDLLNKCWNEGKTPEDWNKSIICPIFKKGSRKECGNYRGIALMPHIAKLYERILEKRLREKVENKLGEWQYGFRSGRSTTDLIFTLKMIYEKSWEWNKNVYLAFIDLEKAFDRVPRRLLWNVLQKDEYRVSTKLVKAIKSTYENSKCKVKSLGREEWFEVTTGVKQGSVLSPIIFITFMDYIGRLVSRRMGDDAEILGYADDLALISHSREVLQRFLNVWDEELKNNGMMISRTKTEVMFLSRDLEDLNINLDEQEIKQGDQFKYLGVMFGTENDMILEINNRISKFNRTFGMLYPILRDLHVPSKVKIVIYTSILRPILTYGYEAWSLTNRTKSKIQACEMKVLRLIKKVTRLDRKRNEAIREELGVESILEYIERGQLRYYGHMKRMDPQRHPRRYYEWIPEGGRRPAGRPRRRWRENVGEAARGRGSTLDRIEDEELYQDRDWWRSFTRQRY